MGVHKGANLIDFFTLQGLLDATHRLVVGATHGLQVGQATDLRVQIEFTIGVQEEWAVLHAVDTSEGQHGFQTQFQIIRFVANDILELSSESVRHDTNVTQTLQDDHHAFAVASLALEHVEQAQELGLQQIDNALDLIVLATVFMVFTVVVNHGGGTQGVFGISLFAGEFQNGEECVQGGLIGPLDERHGSHPATGNFLIELIVNDLITHHLVGGGAANVGQRFQDMVSGGRQKRERRLATN